jgi:hypothetical protein
MPVRRLSLLVALFMLAMLAVPVSAAPKGDARDSDVGKKLFSFNVIAMPQADWSANDSVCPNNGSRMFFQQDADNTLGTIHWYLQPNANQDFNITDCDGTYDGDGAVVANESLNFWVMIKLVGPKTSTLTNVCTDVIDYIGTDDLCLLNGTPVHLNRNSTTKIMQNVAENQYEEVLWQFSGDWKVFQVLIYESL